MYFSIRQYRTNSADELTRRVKESFVPLISQAPGFISYHCINAGDGMYVSVSVFDTQAHAEESNQMAAEWLKKNDGLVLGPPNITAGEVVVHKSGRPGEKGSRVRRGAARGAHV